MVKKLIATICLLTFCLGLLSGCGNSQKKESTQSAETESAAEAETEAALTETEPQTEDPDDPEYLFADLDLSDPADLEEAADRILATPELHTGEAIDEKAVPEGYNHFGITKTEAQAGIVLSACMYYTGLGKNLDPALETKAQEINSKLTPYSLAQKLTADLQPDGGNSENVIVETVFVGTAGMSKVAPTLICLSTDGGKSWDYRLTSYLYGAIKCSGSDFAFTSNYLGNTAADPNPMLIVFENMGESIWEKEIGIEPAEGMRLYEADVLAIEKGQDGQIQVKVGYREQSDMQTEDMYFQTMLYSRDGEGIVLSEEEEEQAE